MYKIVSIYSSLLLLKNNNDIIDLSEDNLCSGTSDFDKFLKNIEIINKADMNIVLGIGGPFNLCQSFFKKSICYISLYNDFPFINYFIYYHNINNNMQLIHLLKKLINLINYYKYYMSHNTYLNNLQYNYVDIFHFFHYCSSK